MDEKPCGSKDNLTAMDSEIDELQFLKDITVRTELQEVLEEQALHELTVFNSKTSADKEDGEISDAEKVVDSEETIVAEKKGNLVSLDINSYIKRQEELRKRQQHVRSLEVSEKSREIARKISKKQKSVPKSELKRKDSNTNTNTNDIVCESLNKVAKKRKGSDSDYIPSDEGLSDVDYEPEHSTTPIAETEPSRKRKRKRVENVINTPKIVDDGSIQCYKARLASYYEKIEEEQKLLGLNNEDADNVIEIYENLKINKKIWDNLYCYQQEGIEWLYELHLKSVGGILGDEMGLGKTVQIIAFLNALDCSKHIPKNRYKGLGPTVIICPATVIHQWVQHFHEWAPEFRVAILHQSGSFNGNKTALIRDINKNNGILITTYLGVLKYKGLLTELNWHYVILDEGHKIRNPNTQVSIAIKEFRTPHRIMLTGSPMQNNLQELWSLFDFTNPGMLGTVTVFMEHFANPIMQGGYANATQMQESMALSMATALKNLITPHLLRRSKQEVREAISLPNKSEQVLFCSLSDEQRDLYKGYLMGEHISRILGRGGKNWFNENSTRANVLVAITTLRKICNHPDLYLEDDLCFGETEGEESIGFYKKSGKMVVISALLKIWKRQKHRVLLFTQSRGMILIFEEFLKQQGYNYLKMDGGTSIKSRQPLIDKFNKDISYDVFLLTTRVGGLGVNLTGANRVVIYDPDWNPATDTQARERAWRIGQEKNVTVYRLISAGTIEEKIYQRQVWKQLLSNKVLLDPKTQRFFKTSDLHDLFSLQEQTEQCGTETGNIFKNSRVSMEKHLNQKKKEKQSKPSKSIKFSDDKIQRMKDLAAQISKTLNTEPKPEKSLDQIDFEQERLQRKQEKEELKKMSAPELHTYNREKSIETHEEIVNKVDEIKTNISFSNALEFSEKTAQLYNEAKTQFDKSKVENSTNEYTTLTTTIIDTSNNCSNKIEVSKSEETLQSTENNKTKRKKHHKKNKRKSESDDFQGEQINGLVKTEMKQIKHQKETNKNETQDQYVLEKLFSKKNVHTALQHDVIVQSGGNSETSSLRIHSETRNRTDLALQALRNSRINTWRW